MKRICKKKDELLWTAASDKLIHEKAIAALERSRDELMNLRSANTAILAERVRLKTRLAELEPQLLAADLDKEELESKLLDKPACWVFDTASDNPTYQEFVSSTMVDQHMIVLRREQSFTDKAEVEEDIREITRMSCGEWYDHRKQPASKNEWIVDIIDEVRQRLSR